MNNSGRMGIDYISAETGIWPVARTRRDRERAAQVALMQETVALAWQVAMYLTHVIYGFSLSAVGRHFGRDRTTAAHACRLVEDRRDDKNFDMLLDRLEQALRSANTGPIRQ